MAKKTILFLLLSTCLHLAHAQQTDSLTFVKAKWQKIRIGKNTQLINYHFENKSLFSANQNISYIEIAGKRNSPVLSIAADEKELKTTSTFGKENQALAALNGTFFDVKNGGSVDFVKANGKIINTTRLENNGMRAAHQKAAVLIQDGRLNIQKWDGTSDWEHNLTAADVMVSGPLLRFDKKDETIDSNAFNTNRHPRTAIGVKPNGKVILLCIDGRNSNSAGATLPELLKIMKWLGCSSAINLDGGGSTTLWVNGFPDSGVINYPTDNKLWDHAGERKVANTILLKKRL